MADEDQVFENTESGASESYPIEAGQIRKGGFIMIKGRPCKVSDVSTSKTGKHGHAKCHFVAIDIFTGKKMEDLVPPEEEKDNWWKGCDEPAENEIKVMMWKIKLEDH